MHRHHLTPKHMGGDDSEENLTPPIPIELHSEFHRLLWLEFGRTEDFIAWKALAGRLTGEQARLLAARVGQAKSDTYKCSRSAAHLRAASTAETCAKGGRAASVHLVAWQKANADVFREQCALNGRTKAPKQRIPHKYMGVRYESKKALQTAHSLSVYGFYLKLARGEITRLD